MIEVLVYYFHLGIILLFCQGSLNVATNRVTIRKQGGDPCLPRHTLKKTLGFIRESVLLIAGKVPTPIMFKPKVIEHDRDDDKDQNLNEHIQADSKPVNLLWFCWGGGVVGHFTISTFLIGRPDRSESA